MTLRTKIIAIMAIPFGVLATAMSAAIVARVHTSDALAAERHAVALRGSFERAIADLDTAESDMRGYLLTGRADFLNSFDQESGGLRRDVNSLLALTRGDPAGTRQVKDLQALVSERLAILQSSQWEAPVTDRTNREELIGGMALGDRVMDEIRTLVNQQEDEAARLLADRERGLDATRQIAFLITIVGTPLGMLVSLLVVMIFMRRMVARILRTEENARRLEEGIPFDDASTTEDELGRLERMLVRSGTRVVELQEELRRQATIDPLTRLANRRGFMPLAEHQLELARRTHAPVALMFLDVDGLKKVNDTLGHASGDALIAEVAYLIKMTFRASDVAGRMGGDEFCVLFPAESDQSVEGTAQRLGDAVAAANAEADRPFAIDLSIGVAVFDPEAPRSLDWLLAEADRQMYMHKRTKLAAT